MEIPRLSICMPTYNFGRFIGGSLDSILNQRRDDMEIVVLDGASQDDTELVVQSYQKRFPQIHYHRMPARGGIDRDMAHSVELARGEYCWLFSADDIMRPGAIDRILNEIESGLDLYVCGLNLCNFDMQILRQHSISDINHDAEFDLGDIGDRLRYFRHATTTTAFFSFMGSLIVKRSRWMATPLNEAFVGSLWAHVARIFEMIPKGLRVRYISEPLLDKRSENDSFMDKGIVHRCRIAVDGYHRLAETFFGMDSEEAFHIRRVIRNEFPALGLLSIKLQSWEQGKYDELPVVDKMMRRVFQDRTLGNFVSRLVYEATPLRVLRSVTCAYRSLKRIVGVR